jgi:hypothetical protein
LAFEGKNNLSASQQTAATSRGHLGCENKTWQVGKLTRTRSFQLALPAVFDDIVRIKHKF